MIIVFLALVKSNSSRFENGIPNRGKHPSKFLPPMIFSRSHPTLLFKRIIFRKNLRWIDHNSKGCSPPLILIKLNLVFLLSVFVMICSTARPLFDWQLAEPPDISQKMAAICFSVVLTYTTLDSFAQEIFGENNSPAISQKLSTAQMFPNLV